jgi:gluconate 5-dehydrogenase
VQIRELFDLTGKVALVTGGSRGLGKAMAEGLAEAGAKLAITARRTEWLEPTAQEFAGRGFECLAVPADVSDPEQVERLVKTVLDRFGQVDILVNGHGVSWGAPVLEMPLDRWKWVIDVNVNGTYYTCRAVGGHMLARGSGSIINVASVVGLLGTPEDILSATGYSASKGGIIALSRDLAVKWGPRGVRVNVIAPGFFNTRLSKPVIERAGDKIRALTPLGRIGEPYELKGLAVFLASEASSYITGQVFVVDGGMSAA